MTRPKIISTIIGLIILAGFIGWYALITSKPTVTNFDDCVKAGYFITTTTPPHCQTSDGLDFIKTTPNNPKPSDQSITTDLQPNALIQSPLTITGQARGSWFFEASFPIHVEDNQGHILGTSIAQTESDWMTENFVPFKATITFNPGTTTTGVLVFKKDNPSGLPEHDQEWRVPIRFK